MIAWDQNVGGKRT